MTYRYYLLNSPLPFDEDINHEFKGHRNIVHEEVPPTSVRHGSRAAISKTINAFLNTGVGGRIYCGVIDNGQVKGLNFSPYQMDHMRVSMQDALASYKPAVPPHRWTLEFVPVLRRTPDQRELEKIYELSQKFGSGSRERTHLIGTHRYCWCDKDSIAAFNNGIVYNDFVAEIAIHPWDPNNPLDAKMVSTPVKINPLHEADDGKVYMRKNASVEAITLQEAIELTKSQLNRYYSQLSTGIDDLSN